MGSFALAQAHSLFMFSWVRKKWYMEVLCGPSSQWYCSKGSFFNSDGVESCHWVVGMHIHAKPSWGKFSVWPGWFYYTSKNSGTKASPFEVTFGKKSPIISYIINSFNIVTVDDLLVNKDTMIIVLRRKLTKAQESMKQFTNVHRKR